MLACITLVGEGAYRIVRVLAGE